MKQNQNKPMETTAVKPQFNDEGMQFTYNITTREIQVALKVSQKRIESLDFSHRLGFEDFDKEQIGQFRRQCKNIKLRLIYYRLITRDFLL